MVRGVPMPKWRPPPGYSRDDADREAKAIDPGFLARFDDTAPPEHRFQVCFRMVIDNVRYGGLVGSGKDWAEALAEAKERWAKYLEAQQKTAAAATTKAEEVP
jgi:hypothetical protein